MSSQDLATSDCEEPPFLHFSAFDSEEPEMALLRRKVAPSRPPGPPVDETLQNEKPARRRKAQVATGTDEDGVAYHTQGKTDAGSSWSEEEVQRRFTFDEKLLREGVSGDHLFDEPPQEDFNEVVDWDDERVEHFVRKELIGVMLESLPFRILILGIIVVNSFLIALQTDESYSIRFAYEFSIFDKVVLVIFVCEILLKWYYDFWIFWKSNSNILDFFIILALFLGPILSFLGSHKMLKILRVLRAFRSLKSISAFAGLSMVIQTILQSLPDMANIFLLLMIIMIVLAVGGVQVFNRAVPKHFGNLQSALFTIFICITQDGWMEIFRTFQEKGGALYIGGAFYFVAAIIIGSFVFANLIVAVVVTNLEWAIQEMKNKQKAAEDILKSDEEAQAKMEFDDTVPILPMSFIHHKEKLDFVHQTPLELPTFDSLSTQKIEHYFLILNAIEENLSEYQVIRGDMEKIFDVVQDFNLIQTDDRLVTSSSLAASFVNEQEIDLTKGDILSNLIKLEGANLLSTKNANTLGQALKTGMVSSQMNLSRKGK